MKSMRRETFLHNEYAKRESTRKNNINFKNEITWNWGLKICPRTSIPLVKIIVFFLFLFFCSCFFYGISTNAFEKRTVAKCKEIELKNIYYKMENPI